jgi:hypothetical protein
MQKEEGLVSAKGFPQRTLFLKQKGSEMEYDRLKGELQRRAGYFDGVVEIGYRCSRIG